VSGVNLKNRLLAVGLILCIASLALIGNVKAQTITAGVSAGNVYDYHVSSYWTSSDSYASIPSDLSDVNKTQHVEVRISSLDGTTINTFTATYFLNGTAVPTRGNVSLTTGEGYYGFMGIIGANLNVGDTIHPSGSDGLTILDSATRNYESGSRQTNHVQIVNVNETAGYTATRDLYFDKATGMLVEQIDQTVTTSPVSTSRVTWKLDSTLNVEGWVVPEFPVTMMLPVFLLAGAFVAIAYKKKFNGASSPI
jgi:hypothetical protein